MSNPFDALDKPDAPAAGNPFDAFDNADDTAAREKVESDPSFRAIVSQFARNRLDGISAEARKLPTLDSVSTLEERDRAKFVRGELDAATAAHEEASRAYRDIQSRGDRDNLGRATEAMDAASRRLAFARELDQDVAGKVVRTATPQQLMLIDKTITEQIRRVDYYESLIEQGDGGEDVKRNLEREKAELIKLEAAREHARQRVADPNRPLDPSAVADVVGGLGQGMGSTFPSLMGAAGERIGQDTGNVGLTEIGRILREYGEGNRRDTVPAPKFSDLSIGKEGFGRDVRRFLATSLGEGVGTSLPIIATYMAGGAPAAMGGSALLGIGQMQSALTEAFAQEGLELPPDKAAWYVYTYGTAIGMLESLTEVWGLRNFTGEAKKRAVKSIAAAMAAGAAKGAVMEGLTEGLQEIVEIAGVSNATGKPIDWDEARRRLIDATAAGAVPGVAFGTVSATGQRKHAFDLALEKAKELGFDTQPQTPAALPGGAPEITPPQDEPPKAPAEASQTLPEPQPATAGPEGTPAPEPQPSTLPPELEPMADAIDAILPDGVGVDRQMFDKPVGDLVAETVAAVTGEPMAVEAAPEAMVPAAPLQPEVQAQAEQIAASPAPEQTLRQYIAEGGSLSRSALPDLARRMAVTEQQLAQVMDEAVKRGELRKTAGGMYRRAAQAPAQAAPSMFKLADSHRQANDALDEALNFGRQILPRGVQVGVRPGRIFDTRTGLEIDGQFDPSAGRIVLSAYAMQPKGVLAHEGLHVLVKQGQMTLDEVVILANHARKTGAFTPEIEQAYRQAYAGRAHINLAIDEEAAAHLIAARVNGADFGKQINAIIDRIRQVLERIANALKGRGFKSVDDVVNALVTGEMAQREPTQPSMSLEQMFSLVDASTGQSMRRDLDALGYYSQALEAAKGLKQAKGTPEQMLAQMKAAGVKDAEIEATGLRGFLEGKKSVSKAEIATFLDQNRVRFNEAFYAGNIENTHELTHEISAALRNMPAGDSALRTEMQNAMVAARRDPVSAYNALSEEARDAIERYSKSTVPAGAAGPKKWNTYSLDPSNPTYRETVLHLPKNEGFQTFEAYRASLPPAEQRYPEANIRAEFEATRPLDNFQSGHFPEPNIIGHMMTSMVKHEGKPTYLIDQIQSDWGQSARDKGVITPESQQRFAEASARADEATKRVNDALAEHDAKGKELLNEIEPGSRASVDGGLFSAAKNHSLPEEVRKAASSWLSERYNIRNGPLASEAARLRAEASQMNQGVQGHPLVNTTDQWVNTTLRRAIRQAAEADADFIAIPSGDTVLSYNPGDEAGMRGFYGRTFSDAEIASYRREIADAKARGDDKAAADYQSALDEAMQSAKEGIVPKNLRNLLRKIDKASPDPIRTDKLETPTAGMKGKGFTVFPLTDTVKQSVMSEGQPMFALNLGSLFRRDQPLSGLNTIIRDLAHDVVLPIRQGLITEAAKKAKKGAKQAGIDLTSYYDPQTGVLRVTRMSDLSAVLGAVGEALIRRFDSVSQSLKGPGRTINPLEKLLAQNSLGLVGQSGRAALWGMLPVPSGQTLVPILRDTLASYLHAWHAYKIAKGNAMMDPSAAKAAERALLNVQRQVARYGNRNLDAAISAEQQRLAALPPLAIAPQDFTDYVDLRYNPSTKITPPQISTLADPAEQRAAFAQWFRGYMLDPASTRMQDPAFFDAFEDLIDREDPTLSAKLDDSQAAIAAHAKAQPVQIIQAMIKSPERVTQMQEWFRQMDRDGLLPTLADWARTLYRGGWDKLHPFYTAVRTLLELHQLNTGKRLDLKAAENAYKLLRLAPHSHAIAGRDLEDGIKNRLTNKPEGPSLVAALKTALGTDRASALDMSPDGPYQKFTAYLIARRAIRLWERFDSGELERPPLGASKDTARATIQTLEAANPEFMAAAEEVYEFQRNLLKLQRDAHLITPELYDQLVKDADYVPFLRDMTDKPGTPKRALSKGAQSIIKKFKGSDRDILDPIATIAQKVYETRQLIAINDAKLMLLQLAESAGPGAGMIAERLDDQQSKAMRVDLKNALRSLANEIGVSNADATALVHLAQQLLGDDMMATVFTKGQMKAGAEPVTWVYEKGVPVPMRLADGDLGRLMYETLENLGREHTHLVVQMMILPTQLVRGTITSNPAFILRNMFVDGLMAWMYEKTAIPWLTQVGGFANAIRQTPEVTEYARNAGLMGGVSTTSLDKLRLDRDVNALIAQGYKPKLWESPGAWMSELARNPLRKLFEASEASETGTRARLYKIAFDRAKANGLNDVEAAAEAAFFAHDYMDYSRSGSVVGPVSRVVAFMNAAMQGMDRYFRLLTAKGDYGSAWKAYMDFRMGKGPALTARENAELAQSAQAWFVSMAVMGSMSLVITALFGDDERLKEIPEELRSTHWIIPLDGVLNLVPKEMPGLREFLKPLENQMLRLPKAFETAWFANLIERVVLEAARGNPRWWENYVRDLKNTLNPPMEPQALQLIYELKTGKSMFSGRDIVPTWKQERLNEMSWDEYTSEFSKWLGKKVDVSPYYIDHTIKGLGTSWARDMLSLNVPGLPWYRENKPEKSLDEVIIARRFLWKAGKGADSSQKVREIMGAEDPVRGVWDRLSTPYSKLDASAETYKEYLKRRDPASASEILDRLKPAERGYAIMDANLEGDASKYKMVHPMHRADRVLREISGLQKEILADLVESKKKVGKKGELIPLDPSEKRAALDALTQFQMMEAHNALVLTGELGWDKRAYFDSASVLAEMKAAVPAVAEEFERRMKKAHVLPFDQVQQVWPKLKETIEAPEFAALSKAEEKREIRSRIRSLYGEAR